MIAYFTVDTVTWKQAMKTWHSDEPQSESKGKERDWEEGEETKQKENNMASEEKKAFQLSRVLRLWFRLFIWWNHTDKDCAWDVFTFYLSLR